MNIILKLHTNSVFTNGAPGLFFFGLLEECSRTHKQGVNHEVRKGEISVGVHAAAHKDAVIKQKDCLDKQDSLLVIGRVTELRAHPKNSLKILHFYGMDARVSH